MSNKLELFDNKIVILYILDNSSMPLTTDQIAKFEEDVKAGKEIDINELKKDI